MKLLFLTQVLDRSDAVLGFVSRWVRGLATHVDEEVTITGMATVSGGVLANKKLRIHLQDNSCGVAVFASETVHADIVSELGVIMAGDILTMRHIYTYRNGIHLNYSSNMS